MPGFVFHDNIAAVQESIYIVLGHGPYQRRVLLCSVLSVIVALFQALSDHLTNGPVDHWCRPPKNLRELSADAWKNMSIPVEADGSFSKCTVYDPVVADTPAANRSTAPCQSWDYDIANRADSIVSRFGLICDRQYLLNLGTGIFVMISALVTPVLGFASDRVGRRPVTLASVIVLLTGTVGSSVSGTFTFYVSTRTVVLTTANTVFMLIFILLYEVTGKQWRLLFTILVTAVGITVVPPFVDALSLLKPRWVLLHGVIIVPTAILAACCCLLRESPAWLLATWDVQRAQEGVLEAAILNGLDTAKAAATFRAILVQLVKIDQSQHFSTDASDGRVQSVKMRRQVASVFLARLTLNAIYFPLAVKGRSLGYYWLAVHTVLLAASYVAVCWAVVKRGLRDTLIILLVIVCALSAVQTMLMSVSGLQILIPVVDAALKIALAGSMSVTLCYSAEVFPTSIRCAGVSASLFFGYVGSLLGILVHALSGRKIGSLFHGTAAILTALSVFAVQWLPEVLVETRKAKREAAPASAQERKEALKQSLALPVEDEKRRRRRKGQMKTPNKSPA
ncbi:carcinine transporter-like [Dermacentor andersoni]|uniref:carcinine transporter-like n=1 Tax=Dermacentor andersoni TaxID=34620 RepID=UPI00215504E7|nr:carcinine transporter-like [Dermacentor andersoni]